jgi:hypothetical protein
MEEALREIWRLMGIPQVWGAVLTILFLAIAFLLKKLIDQRAEKQNADREMLHNQFADIADFAKEQSVGLIKAYLGIFEGKDAVEAEGKQFAEIVEKADNDLMKPVRKYSAKLDDKTKAKIFAIHNILAQYYPDPSNEAIAVFKKRKVEFYAKIDDAQKALRPDLILHSLGLVSRTLPDKRRE